MEPPKDLITPENTPDLELMTHLYEKMTGFPPEDLVVLREKHLLYFETKDDHEGKLVEHVCLMFPFVGDTAQAYDCVYSMALHVKHVRGDGLVASVYVPSRDFRVVAPFVVSTTIALTKKENRPVIINAKGEVVLDPAPRFWLKGLFH